MNKFNLLSDPYYSTEYASLYVDSCDQLFTFNYQEKDLFFHTLSLKRAITNICNISTNSEYYDLETPYGYGGFYSNSMSIDFLKRAFGAYKQKCRDEKIIAEFIRFHPYNPFPENFLPFFDFLSLDRKTVSINLNLSRDDRWKGYSVTTRNQLRRLNPSLTLSIDFMDINVFWELYHCTMDRNNAEKSYYFSKKYFEKLLNINNVKLFTVMEGGIPIHMSFILIGENFAHYHLSASSQRALRLNANYFLIDGVCDYIKINHPSVSLFHLGGGRTNLPNDGLLAFKAKFSNFRNNFYIAGNVYNNNVYQDFTNKAVLLNPFLKNKNFFLKYRLENHE